MSAMTRHHTLTLGLALGLVGLAGCKVQPTDYNRVPGHEQYLGPVIDAARSDMAIPGARAAGQPEPGSGLPGTEDMPPAQGGGDGPGAGGGGGEGAGGPVGRHGDLSPAAREAVKYLPHGYAGEKKSTPGLRPGDLYEDEIPVRDRWRIGFPAWERGSQSDSPYDMSAWWDPYHQNILKGDYPLPGTQNTFLNLEVTSLTRYENRKVPTPSGVFPIRGGSGEFFGQGNQKLVEELLLVSADLFQGETFFKPVDWRLFVRGAFNWNHAKARENQALFADPQKGFKRRDNHAALQQAFFETTLASVNDKYDVIQTRIGTQLFNSDFKGFLFFDEALGYRLFGSLDDNHYQWNVGWFKLWEKDTNSTLNKLESKKQNVFVANLYRQDVLAWLMPRYASEHWSHGLQTQISYHRFTADESVHYDENGFLVRPRGVGTVQPTSSKAHYLGWTMDGHVGRLNITSALYHAFGNEDINAIANRRTDINALMAALELSVDVDWMRFRTHFFYQSGDSDPLDDDAEGFDAVFDNPVFAGGEFGFWNRNTVRLTGSGVGLVQRFSLLNSLRSSKDEGQPSYVNPGLLLAGVGYDAQLTPHLKVITNASYLTFDHTESMEFVLNQDAIGEEIGWDLSVGVLWRPLLTDNVIVKGGASALIPGDGFQDIYTSETLYAFFAELILTW